MHSLVHLWFLAFYQEYIINLDDLTDRRNNKLFGRMKCIAKGIVKQCSYVKENSRKNEIARLLMSICPLQYIIHQWLSGIVQSIVKWPVAMTFSPPIPRAVFYKYGTTVDIHCHIYLLRVHFHAEKIPNCCRIRFPYLGLVFIDTFLPTFRHIPGHIHMG